MGCRELIPGWSLFAAILQCLGVAMFCSSAVLGVNKFLQLLPSDGTTQTNMTTQATMTTVDDDVIYYIEIGVYSLTAFMMVWAIGFLFNAFMVTAQTNSPVWDRSKISCSSSCCVGLSVFLNTVAMILWVIIVGASFVPFTFSFMLSEYYYMEFNGTSVTPTVDFKYYGLRLGTFEVVELQDISYNLIIFFSLACGGAVLVTFGLVCSIACMTSNWARLSVGDKWEGYADKRNQEETELRQINTHKSSEQLANSLYY